MEMHRGKTLDVLDDCDVDGSKCARTVDGLVSHYGCEMRCEWKDGKRNGVWKGDDCCIQDPDTFPLVGIGPSHNVS